MLRGKKRSIKLTHVLAKYCIYMQPALGQFLSKKHQQIKTSSYSSLNCGIRTRDLDMKIVQQKVCYDLFDSFCVSKFDQLPQMHFPDHKPQC